jgi:hypothetical protein
MKKRKVMQQYNKLKLQNLKGDFKTYFNWSANALMPVNPCAADDFLVQNRSAILKIAHTLLEWVSYTPCRIYRGVILKQIVDTIAPHQNLKYLSFSTDLSVAEHFADIQGFGSEVMNIEKRLGEYGYVIEYIPKPEEILFHYGFLSILPYAEAFSLFGMNGKEEVQSLRRQKEIIILQPAIPFNSIKRQF